MVGIIFSLVANLMTVVQHGCLYPLYCALDFLILLKVNYRTPIFLKDNFDISMGNRLEEINITRQKVI